MIEPDIRPVSMSPGRLALASGLVFFVSSLVLGLIAVLPAASRAILGADAQDFYLYPLAQLAVFVVSVGGLLGLGVSFGWYVLNVARERAQDAGDAALAAQVERLLADGTSRAATQARLAESGAPTDRITRALELEWPHGTRCPRCGESVRRFVHLAKYLDRSWWHCPSCEWVGQVQED